MSVEAIEMLSTDWIGRDQSRNEVQIKAVLNAMSTVWRMEARNAWLDSGERFCPLVFIVKSMKMNVCIGLRNN